MAIIPIPDGIEFDRIDWRPTETVQVNRAWNRGARRTLDLDNGYYRASVAISASTLTEVRKIKAFRARLRGPANTFRLPFSADDGDQTAGDLTATADTAAGAVSLAVHGPNNMPLIAGMMVTLIFDTDVEQIVMLTADTSLNGSGNGTIHFEPPARQAIANAAAVLAQSPTGLVALAPGTGEPEDSNGTLTWAFEVEEAF